MTASTIGTYSISVGLGKSHHRVMTLIKRHMNGFKSLGDINYTKIRIKGSDKPITLMDLNVGQVNYLLSLFRDKSDLYIKFIKDSSLITLMKMLSEMDIDTPSRDLFVYAAQDARGNLKIGISNNPMRRLAELNIGNPDELTLVFSRPAVNDGYADEKALHHKCANYHIRSEWFSGEAKHLLT